jgi:hypothetical protein
VLLTVYVGEVIKAMKCCARKPQVLWIVIAYPAKLKQGDTINLYSISDSAHWFNKPDIGLVIIRPADDGDAKLRVASLKKSAAADRSRSGSIRRPGASTYLWSFSSDANTAISRVVMHHSSHAPHVSHQSKYKGGKRRPLTNGGGILNTWDIRKNPRVRFPIDTCALQHPALCCRRAN